MTTEQTNKLFKNISENLIPAIIEVQTTGLYPQHFEISNFGGSEARFRILNETIEIIEHVPYERRIRRGVGGLGYVEPDPPTILDINKIEEWKIPDETLLKNSPFWLIAIAKEMVSFLQAAENYQMKICEIIKFSESISIPLYRRVFTEKIPVF